MIVGVDLGATFVRAALFDARGHRLDVRARPLEAERGPETGIQNTIALIDDLLRANGSPKIAGIGAGATGPVDSREGAIQNPYTLPAWAHVPFTEPLTRHFGVPAVLENDADVAALGEYWQGAGRGVERLLAVTLGTGIGTAFILKGDVYRGLNSAHPESGHHVIDAEGPECYCGARGCWEALAGGDSLLAYIRGQAEAHPEWPAQLGLSPGQAVDVAAVAQAARAGEPRAAAIWAREARYVAIGLMNLISFFVPETVVLSGGVMKSYDLIEPALRAYIRKNSLMVPAGQVRIIPAELGYYAGVTGAAYALLLALDAIPNKN